MSLFYTIFFVFSVKFDPQTQKTASRYDPAFASYVSPSLHLPIYIQATGLSVATCAYEKRSFMNPKLVLKPHQDCFLTILSCVERSHHPFLSKTRFPVQKPSRFDIFAHFFAITPVLRRLQTSYAYCHASYNSLYKFTAQLELGT